MVYIYIAADSVCKRLFDIRSVFHSRQSTNKLMSHGFLQSRLQAVFRKFYCRYNDLALILLGHMLSCVSYKSLGSSCH
jgi:hypothetical protein